MSRMQTRTRRGRQGRQGRQGRRKTPAKPLARDVQPDRVMLRHGTVRYCTCGCPIVIRGRWTGEDFRLLLYDGRDDGYARAERGPLDHCPQCGELLDPSDLRFLPPRSLFAPPAFGQTPEQSHAPNDQPDRQ